MNAFLLPVVPGTVTLALAVDCVALVEWCCRRR